MEVESLTIFPAQQPISASLQLNGSKSFMNRGLILAALAEGPSLLLNPSRSEDSMTLLRMLKSFGISSRWREDGGLVVQGGRTKAPQGEVLDVGPAGTVMRFMTSLAAATEGVDVTLRGSDRMHERPIGALVDALRTLGADIEYLETDGCPPLRIRGKELKGGAVEIDGAISSQFLTSLMLVGATFQDGLELLPKGDLVSRSYLRMTCHTLRSFGVELEEAKDGSYKVFPGAVKNAEYLVEGDASGASYLWGLAAIADGAISLSPFPIESLQGDIRFPFLLEKMGCEVTANTRESSITVRGPSIGRLKPIEANMENMPDTAQTLAVLAAVADGTSVLTGLQTLRIKETDRILALQQELKKVGVETQATEDSLTIHGVSPDRLQRAEIDTYDDHRMAMSFALLGAVIPGIVIRDPMVVIKSFPDFWERLHNLGFETS